MMRRAAGCVLVWCLVHSAQAGNTGLSGFNTLTLRPAAGAGVYSVQGATTLPRGAWYVGTMLHAAHGAITAVMPARAATIDLVRDVVVTDLRAAYGATARLQLGVGLPLLWQRGTDIATLNAYAAAGLGDLRLDAVWNLVRDRRGAAGVSLQSILDLPTGSRALFAGDGAVTWEGRVLAQKTWRPLTLFANAGYRVLPARTVLTTTDDDRVTAGVGVDAPLPWRERTWHVRGEVGVERVLAAHSTATTPIEARAGLRKIWASGWMLDVGGGAGLTAAYGAPAYRGLIGIAWDGAARRMPPQPIDYAVYFARGSARVAAHDYDPLRAIGRQLADAPMRRVRLSGYTDRTGTAAANLRLSLRRAQHVQRYLQYFGADPVQCAVEAHGEVRSPSATPQHDRRVDIQE